MNIRALFALCFGLLVTAFGLTACDQEYRTVKRYDYTDFTIEAHRNRFLAAEKFIQAMQADAESVETLIELPPLPDELPQHGTVILGSTNMGMNNRWRDNLLTWVDGGGHLWIYAGSVFDDELQSSQDPILDHLGVRPFKPEVDAVDDDWWDPKGNPNTAVPPSWQWQFNSNYLPSRELAVRWRDEKMYTVELNPQFYIYQQYNNRAGSPVWSAGDEHGELMMLFEHGAGYITVVSDMSWFNNYRLGDHDHATFLWAMLQPAGPLETTRASDYRPVTAVWLQYLEIGPRWWQLLLDAAWPLLIAVVILLLLFMWMASLRIGPALPAAVVGRRSLLEHVVASARFRWRWGQQHILLRAARQRVERQLQRNHPAWGRLDQHERLDLLMETYEISRKEIEFALFKPVQSEREFVLAMRTLQSLS